MADQIVNTVTFRDNSDNSVKWHVVHYDIIDGEDTQRISVQVYKEEMTDEEDLTELKTLANVKAATEKTVWIAAKNTLPVEEARVDNNGDVTL